MQDSKRALCADIRNTLLAQQEAAFQAFQARLLPTLPPETILGVRTPQLRAMAKTLSKDARIGEFLDALPHRYFEENQLHAFLIETIRDYDEAMRRTEAFLPFVDNWATCDCFHPKVFKKQPEKTLAAAARWIASGRTYTVRYGVGILMSYFLDAQFDQKQAALVASIRSDEYYVNMMVAWYFATALAKQPDTVRPYFSEPLLPLWSRKKAISKALESYRIPEETKTWLRALRAEIGGKVCK